jgi:hypothetical protein
VSEPINAAERTWAGQPGGTGREWSSWAMTTSVHSERGRRGDGRGGGFDFFFLL